jgi:hypothetical protein
LDKFKSIEADNIRLLNENAELNYVIMKKNEKIDEIIKLIEDL